MGDLDGKTVVISGVGDGLGREIALVCHREGANCVLGARTEANLEKVAAELGDRVAYRTTDITDEAQCQGLVQAAVDAFGGVDAVVNCAAFDAVFGGLESAGDFADWRTTVEVNLVGSMQMTRAALPQLKQRQGNVVFVSSQTQHHPPPLAPQMAYAASKGALTGAMRHLAQEVGPHGVNVNEVAPSWMWGPPVQMFVKMQVESTGASEEEVINGIVGDFPLRRMCTDEEVAEVIAFLASPRASGMTGQTVFVNVGEIVH